MKNFLLEKNTTRIEHLLITGALMAEIWDATIITTILIILAIIVSLSTK